MNAQPEGEGMMPATARQPTFRGPPTTGRGSGQHSARAGASPGCWGPLTA